MFLKSNDMFGTPIEFNINGNGSVGTKLGGFITICIYIFGIAIFCSAYYAWSNEFSPTTSYEFSNIDLNSSSTYNTKDLNISFIMGEVKIDIEALSKDVMVNSTANSSLNSTSNLGSSSGVSLSSNINVLMYLLF